MKFKVIKKLPTHDVGEEVDDNYSVSIETINFLKENNLIDKYLEEIKPELTYKPFTPDRREKYYYVSDGGEIVDIIKSSLDIDSFRIDPGNAFLTKEEAEHHRDWLIARKRIMDSSDSESAWENPEQKKWAIYYDHASKSLSYTCWSHNQYSSLPPYESKEEAEQAMQDLEDEYLVYFGVKRSLED